MRQSCGLTLGAIVGATLVALTNVKADYRGYSGVLDLEVESGQVFASHFHDWRARIAYIKLGDAQTRTISLWVDSPPLTHIWLSPDQRYFVGLSTIKYGNKTQILVFDLREEAKYQRSVSCSDKDFSLQFGACGESVTNFVYWFDETAPDIVVEEINDTPASLVVNSLPVPLNCKKKKHWKSSIGTKKKTEPICRQERVSFVLPLAK